MVTFSSFYNPKKISKSKYSKQKCHLNIKNNFIQETDDYIVSAVTTTTKIKPKILQNELNCFQTKKQLVWIDNKKITILFAISWYKRALN